MHKYALKWYRQNHFEPLKHRSKGAKSTQKSGVFVAKSGKMGLKKSRTCNHLERQSGAKCKLFS